MDDAVRFKIPGAPITKKNHGRRIWRKNKKTGKNQPYHIPSEAHEAWHDKAMWFMNPVVAYLRRVMPMPIAKPISVAAIFYRETNSGDACGFYQALGDLLEHAGVITNDRLIHNWDGSRLRKDAREPRIEVTITFVNEE